MKNHVTVSIHQKYNLIFYYTVALHLSSTVCTRKDVHMKIFQMLHCRAMFRYR